MNRHPWRALAAALAAGALVPAAASASPPVSWTGVPSANPKVTGASPANVLSPELSETAVAWGSLALDGATSAVPYYGYDGFTDGSGYGGRAIGGQLSYLAAASPDATSSYAIYPAKGVFTPLLERSEVQPLATETVIVKT